MDMAARELVLVWSYGRNTPGVANDLSVPQQAGAPAEDSSPAKALE